MGAHLTESYWPEPNDHVRKLESGLGPSTGKSWWWRPLRSGRRDALIGLGIDESAEITVRGWSRRLQRPPAPADAGAFLALGGQA